MYFFVPKDDVIRHKLLHLLYIKIHQNKKRVIPEHELAITVKDIAHSLNITDDKVRLIATGLDDREIKFEDFGEGECVVPCEDTATSYAAKKYIKQGRTHLLSRTKDYLGITTAIIAIISALITATIAMLSIKSNQKRIEELEKGYLQLKSQLNQSNPPK